MQLASALALPRIHAIHLARVEVVVEVRVLLVKVRAYLSVPVPLACSAKLRLTKALMQLCVPVHKEKDTLERGCTACCRCI